MKKYIFTLYLILATVAISIRANGQTPDYLGLPGDNLNLFAVMKLFQESQTLEIFERNLNNEDMHINNLDLDQDGRIDYIRVVDNPDGNYHTIVLQDALSPRDIQDIAVFTVYRDRHGRVSIQLTGDEALYGRDYIVEPNYADLDYNETPNPGYTYYNGNAVVVRTSTVEVAAWPVIRFIFMPTYVVWHSPWYYNYYPSYWHPWRPYYWHYYYGYHYNWDPYYYGHYRVYHYHRDPYWHDTYYSQRRNHSHVVTTHIESGSYRRTYSNPEARKAGYDMYYKKHPEQSARRSSKPIEDPVARKSTEQRGTSSTRRKTLGESQIRERNSGTFRSGTESRSRSTGTTQSETRTRSTGTTQSETRTRSTGTVQPETRTRSTGTSTDSRVSNTNQKPRTLGDRKETQTRTQTQTRTETQTRTQSQPRGSQHQTETHSSGSSERRSSDAHTSGTSKKAASDSKSQEKQGGRRTAN